MDRRTVEGINSGPEGDNCVVDEVERVEREELVILEDSLHAKQYMCEV